MFHRQAVPEFEEVLAVNLLGSIRLARAAAGRVRADHPGGLDRRVARDVGLPAYAASKGGLPAFGRSLAAEGAGKGVLTNMLLPYALTQLTADGISGDGVRRRMTAEAVAPVLTALASPDCTLNGEYIGTGGDCCRGRRRWSGRRWRCPAGLR